MVPSRHAGLLVVLALGAALRLVLVFAYTPAYLSYPDSWGYVANAAGPLFPVHAIRPAGYPAFLVAAHAISSELAFTIVLQHVLGLLTAILAYLTLLRFGAPRWVALVPAGVVALTMDSIYFEHTLLSEWLFALLLAGGGYAFARSFSSEDAAPSSALAWSGLAGALLAMATTVRTVGLFAVPVFVLAALVHPAPTAGRRLARATMPGVVATILLLGYAALNSSQSGFFGLSEGSGWAVYSRAAPFADCRKFDPPANARGLCETTDVRLRGGPDFYGWNDASPGRKLFEGPPLSDDVVGSFGRAAILGEPTAYLSAVVTDAARFVDPDIGLERAGNGAPPGAWDIGGRDSAAEALIRSVVDPYYGPTTVRLRGAVTTLSDIQRVVRVHGALILAAVVLAVAGAPFASRRERVALLALGGGALIILTMSVALTVYNWRYAVPVLPWLLAAGALGGRALAVAALRRLRPVHPATRDRSLPATARAR